MFITATLFFTVAVPPSYVCGKEILAAEEVLDSKLLKYDQKFDGMILAYEGLAFTEEEGVFQDEQPDVLFRFRTQVLIYSPKKGEKLLATVSDIQPGHTTLLVAGVFPIIVVSSQYPSDTIVGDAQVAGAKCLVNSKTHLVQVLEGCDYLVKCLKVTYQAGMLSVEGRFIID